MPNKLKDGLASQPPTETPRAVEVKKHKNPVAKAFSLLGPGLITGASDDDPSGIATYSTVGAGFAYSTLWLAIFTYPLMLSIQYICAKIGIVSGQGLAGVLRKHYPPTILWVALAMLLGANIINAGADIGAIASGVHLLLPQISEVMLIAPITIIMTACLVFFSYKTTAKVFKWLTLSLFAYVFCAFFCHIDAMTALHDTFIPNLGKTSSYLQAVVAVLGTTISPYLFFWQANSEVDEAKEVGENTIEKRKGASKDDLKYMAMDVGFGMLVSNIVMFFIILTTAATLHAHGISQIDSASQAAKALEPLLGKWAEVVFALGFIATGFLAVPVLLGSSSYAIAEAMGWPCGLSEDWRKAKRFYALIVISMVAAMLFNYLKINPMQALYWTAILNGVLAPPLLIMIMLISRNKKVMGDRTNSKLVGAMGWLTTAVMSVATVMLIWSSIADKH